LQCCCSACDEVFQPRQSLNSFVCSVHADSEQGEPPGQFTGIHPVLVVGVSLAPLEGQAVSKTAVTPVEPPAVTPVLIPVRRAVELPIGLDDPTLADKVSNTALHGDGNGPSLTYHVLGEEEEEATPSVPEITIALEGSEERSALQEESTAEAVDLPEPVETESLPETEQPAEPVAGPAPAPAPVPVPLIGFGAFMVVALLPSSMAVGAWHYSTLWGQNPSQVSPAAGVIGLLLSWLWIRWKFRTR
jgi:hypothetical protein